MARFVGERASQTGLLSFLQIEPCGSDLRRARPFG